MDLFYVKLKGKFFLPRLCQILEDNSNIETVANQEHETHDYHYRFKTDTGEADIWMNAGDTSLLIQALNERPLSLKDGKDIILNYTATIDKNYSDGVWFEFDITNPPAFVDELIVIFNQLSKDFTFTVEITDWISNPTCGEEVVDSFTELRQKYQKTYEMWKRRMKLRGL